MSGSSLCWCTHRRDAHTRADGCRACRSPRFAPYFRAYHRWEPIATLPPLSWERAATALR